MPESPHAQPPNGDPTAAEIYSVFRSTTTATIEGLRLLLEECAELRGELITVHSFNTVVGGDGVFRARQQTRILELRGAAKEMEAVLASLPGEAR